MKRVNIQKTGVFVSVPKTSNATQFERYRTISLITDTCKILLHIIKERIPTLTEKRVMESQIGFRKGSGTRESIYVLRIMGESMIQQQKDLCIALLIIKKHLTE